jgi:hypothetical protein
MGTLNLAYLVAKSYLLDLLKKIWAYLKHQKSAIGAAAVTALALDVITGLIFGFAGAAVFAAV